MSSQKRGLAGKPSVLAGLMGVASQTNAEESSASLKKTPKAKQAKSAKKKGGKRGAVAKGRAEPARLRQQKTSEPVTAAQVLPLHDIKPRAGTPTRGINLGHVADLAESIQALGLIQPIAVDTDGHIIAGGHRYAAMKVLAAPAGERTSTALKLVDQHEIDKAPSGTWATKIGRLSEGTGAFEVDQVPVRVFRIDTDKGKDSALALEIAENEKRRDYTKTEVQAMWERLKKAGYRRERENLGACPEDESEPP